MPVTLHNHRVPTMSSNEKRIGRPPIDPARRKDKLVKFVLTQAEYEALAKFRDEKRLDTDSAAVRSVLLDKLRRSHYLAE